MNVIFLLFVQQHEASCLLELPEQNQWWPVPGEEQFVQSLLNCIHFLLYYQKCPCCNLHILPLLYLLYLRSVFLFLLQTRGGSHFRESRGLSSSTVDLYTGNWAAGGQAAFCRPICSPTQRCSFLSTLPDSVSLHTPCLWPKDPLLPRLGPKDIFILQKLFLNSSCCFLDFQRRIAVCFPHHVPNIGVAMVPPKCGQENIPLLSPESLWLCTFTSSVAIMSPVLVRFSSCCLDLRYLCSSNVFASSCAIHCFISADLIFFLDVKK